MPEGDEKSSQAQAATGPPATPMGLGPLGPPASAAPPLGSRPNEPTPGKDSLAHPQGRPEAEGGNGAQGPTCPDCGLPFGEHPDFHMHGDDGPARMDLPGRGLDQMELGGDPAES